MTNAAPVAIGTTAPTENKTRLRWQEKKATPASSMQNKPPKGMTKASWPLVREIFSFGIDICYVWIGLFMITISISSLILGKLLKKNLYEEGQKMQKSINNYGIRNAFSRARKISKANNIPGINALFWGVCVVVLFFGQIYGWHRAGWVGNHVMGIRVVDKDGKDIGYLKIIWRIIIKTVTFGGIIEKLLGKRPYYDKIPDTWVVKRAEGVAKV